MAVLDRLDWIQESITDHVSFVNEAFVVNHFEIAFVHLPIFVSILVKNTLIVDNKGVCVEVNDILDSLICADKDSFVV